MICDRISSALGSFTSQRQSVINAEASGAKKGTPKLRHWLAPHLK